MNRLKQLRLEQGHTLQQVSDATGISVEDLIAYENMPIGVSAPNTPPPSPNQSPRKIGF